MTRWTWLPSGSLKRKDAALRVRRRVSKGRRLDGFGADFVDYFQDDDDDDDDEDDNGPSGQKQYQDTGIFGGKAVSNHGNLRMHRAHNYN